MISLFANPVGVEKLGGGAAPIQVRTPGASGSQESSAAGFAGMILALLGGPRPAADVQLSPQPSAPFTSEANAAAPARAAAPATDVAMSTNCLAFLAPESLPRELGLAVSDGVPTGGATGGVAGRAASRATYLPGDIAGLPASTSAGRQWAGGDVGAKPQAMRPGTVAAADLAISAVTPRSVVADQIGLDADTQLLPSATADPTAEVAVGRDADGGGLEIKSTRNAPPQIDVQVPAGDVAPRVEVHVPARDVAPQIDVQAPAGDAASRVEVLVPDRDVAPQSEAATSKSQVTAPRVEVAAPRGGVTDARVAGDVEGVGLEIKSTPNAPSQIDVQPPAGDVAPRVEVRAPARDVASQIDVRVPAGDAASRVEVQVPARDVAPQVSTAIPRSEVTASENGATTPRADVTTPQVDVALSQGRATTPQRGAAAAVGGVLPAVEGAPSDPARQVTNRDQVAGTRDRIGLKPEPTDSPPPAGHLGTALGAEGTSLAARAFPSRADVSQSAPGAVVTEGKAAAAQATGEESTAGGVGGKADPGVAQPGVVTEATSNGGQTAYGGEGGRQAQPAEASAPRRQPAPAGFDTLDSPVNVGAPVSPKAEGQAAADPGPQTEQVVSAVLDRVESTKAAGREEARFEIQTDDGQAIDVKISIHRNVVRARIGVSTVEMQDALAGRIWELGQRLESGGLTPENLEVVLLGDWSGGSRQGGQRRPPKQRTGYGGQDQATATLVEAEGSGFERWI